MERSSLTDSDVMEWVGRYERAWRAADLDAVDELFTPDARYRTSPYEESLVGHDAIKTIWRDEELVFTVVADTVAVDGQVGVVRLEVHYGNPVRQEYRDLWVITFAPDGRCADFEEWAYWPGRPVSALTPAPD
jgi:ketosteroid isomerase-like protein